MRIQKQGFTLVELMIVVAIVAILATVAHASYGAYKMQGYEREAETTMLQIASQARQQIYDWGLKKDASDTNGAITTGITNANPTIASGSLTGVWSQTDTSWTERGINLEATPHHWSFQLCFFFNNEEEDYFVYASMPAPLGPRFGKLGSNMTKPIFSQADPGKACGESE